MMQDAPHPVEPRPKWQSRLTSLSLFLFCLEVGLFLLFLPWSRFWDGNYFAGLPMLRDIWTSPYMRGAVSGLGVANILLALVEAARMGRPDA